MTTERLSLRIDVELKRNLEREAIHAAIAEAETGAFVSKTAMDTWISSWDTDSELPPPEPDTFTDSK